MIKPFKIAIVENALDQLDRKISDTRWPDSINDAGWKYGADITYMKALADHWQNRFNWRKVESEINAFPNFIAEIDGYKIHFLHIKGKGQNSIPLIITHGWPGSFLEMMKLIPLLTGDTEFSFDLVIPSIMGFGFSEKITEPGCNLWLMAGLWYKLMLELGYQKFMAQGGDFGAGISTALALKHPGNLYGLHLNYIPGSYFPYLAEGESLTAEETKSLESADQWYKDEGAYAHQHKTKPLSLAYGLNDSPIGLCAWIVEKMMTWSDCNGDIETVFTKDEILANVSLYWFTETIHSSMRLYHENSMVPLRFTKDDFVNCPVGIARFHKEEPFPSRRFIERGYNIQHWTDINKGGHFAAMEQPHLLAADIIKFTKGILTT